MPRSEENSKVDAQEAQVKEFDAMSEEIRTLRGELHTALNKIADLSTRLCTKAKKSELESASGYVLFSNAHLRLANAMRQGIQRTVSTDRILARGRNIREQEQKVRETKERKERKPLINLPPKDTDFEELFGAVLGSESE